MFEWFNRHKKNSHDLHIVVGHPIVHRSFTDTVNARVPALIRWIVKVNGDRIQEYAYQNRLDAYRQNMQKNQSLQSLSDEEMKRDRVLQDLIQSKLVEQKAGEWGIGTTDEEVRNAIRQHAVFQRRKREFQRSEIRGGSI